MEGTIGVPVKAKVRPWRRWLNHALQALWILAAIFVVQLLIVSIRPGYLELMKVCTEPISACPDGQLTPEGVASLKALGISISAFAVLQLFLTLAMAAIYAMVSLLIFRAKYNDTFALYTSLVLLLYGAFLSNYVQVMREVQPWFADLIDLMPGLTLIAFAILCYIFPDGHFVPRWTRWAAWGWIVAPVVLIIATVGDVYDAIIGPVSVILLGLLASCIIAPILRYRKLSSRTQRQQLKWVLFGLAQLLCTLLIGVELLPRIFPVLDVAGTLPNLVATVVESLSVMLFPVTVGIALLRYRLWNVDLVINRTLVYVPLTSILTVIYSTSMAVSQRLFTTATGEQSQAVAIFTTIILTTTFTPIKNALQSYVDKNFKEAPGNLKELKELNSQVSQVVQALDHKSLAQRVVETIVQAHNAKGAALYFCQGQQMVLAHATPEWVWVEGEVSILLSEAEAVYGRLLLGQRSDRDDYTLDEIEEIRQTTLPIVRNMHRLAAIQSSEPA
jgi:hypothetical protein